MRETVMGPARRGHPIRAAARAAALACAITVLHSCARPPGDDRVTVFAGAAMTDALTDLLETGEEEAVKGRGAGAGSPAGTVLSFGASSTLARQIEHGAPADIYVSAAEEWMDYLSDRSLLEPGTRRVVARNRLVLIAKAGSGLSVGGIGEGTDLSKLLGGGRLAMGDPEHVPVGKYAHAALASIGQWRAVEDRIAPTQDTRAALLLVERGEAPLGIVYSSDAASSDGVTVLGTFAASSHPQILFSVAVVRGRMRPSVSRVLETILGSAAAKVLAMHGFAPADADADPDPGTGPAGQ